MKAEEPPHREALLGVLEHPLRVNPGQHLERLDAGGGETAQELLLMEFTA